MMVRAYEVKDGVICPDEWRTAPERILWLLKEVNDPGHEMTDLSADLLELARRSKVLDKDWRATYRPVAKVSHGLLQEWSEDPTAYVPALARIAVMNVRSIGGDRTASHERIEVAFGERKAHLRAQVAACAPTIIIGGNTLWLDGWWPEAFVRTAPARETAPFAARALDGVVWVHASHPANRRGDRRYFEKIRGGIAAART